ncbi:flagellar biosynthetic protein FliO [Shouchella sp. 1P09AA]|uniref:flagellar biosynthetic protein FliO n=1 Tax=unclassified Shouchella TaxID=2893065 RepID=UPI00399FE6B7
MRFQKQSVKVLLFVVVVLCFALAEHEHVFARDCSVQEAMVAEDCSTSTTEEENQDAVVTAESPWLSGLKMIGALLVVIVLLLTILKFINKRSRSFQESKGLSLLSGVSLGGNRSVQLIKVGEKLLVVGVSEQVQLLDTIEDPDEIEAILKKHQPDINQSGINHVFPWFRSIEKKRQSSVSFQDILATRLNVAEKGLDKASRIGSKGPKFP